MKSGLDRLDKSFCRSANKYLQVKLYKQVNQKSIEISIEEQAVVLNAHRLLPHRLRSFYHLIFYTYINIKRKHTSLFNQMLSFKKVDKRNRIHHQFDQPIFLTISICLLNLFLYDFLNVSKYSFLKSFKNHNNLINFCNKFIKNRNSAEKWYWCRTY